VELVRFFASGSHPPQVPRPGRAAGLPDAEFLARVQEFAGFRDEALDDPELLELVLPALRADVEMHEAYRPSTQRPLPVPITAVRGRDDLLVSAAEAAGWAGATTAGFDLVELPGGHMYLTGSAEPLLELLRSTVG
jgi:surfactin synthase thioesterase subunit